MLDNLKVKHQSQTEKVFLPNSNNKVMIICFVFEFDFLIEFWGRYYKSRDSEI